MYVGARDDPTLPFAKLRKYHYSSTSHFTFTSIYLFLSVRVLKYIKYNPMDRLCNGPTLLCAEWFWLFSFIYLI